MKRYLCYAAVFLFLVGGCRNGDERKTVELKDLELTCIIEQPVENEVVRLVVNGEERVFEVPDSGKVIIRVDRIAPQYSELIYGRKAYSLYLSGGTPMEIMFSGNVDNWKRVFSGANKKINEYLSSSIAPFEPSYFTGDEDQLAEDTERLLKKNLRNLEKWNLPEDFTELERERLCYEAYGSWYSYRMNHRWRTGDERFEPSEKYYSILEKLAKERPELTDLGAYYQFVKRTAGTLAVRETEPEAGEVVRQKVAYFREHYRDSVLLEKLVYETVFDYFMEYGIDGESELVAAYEACVHAPEKLRALEELRVSWEKLRRGDPSPEFKLPDVGEKMVALESFRGKYVYIDLWASWCVACRREIPLLKRLEKKYADKNIVFVSISCDNDREAWLQAIKDEAMEGVQLYMGDDLSFGEAYLVNFLPRFILLDKEGHILNAFMTPPSAPATEETLDSIL